MVAATSVGVFISSAYIQSDGSVNITASNSRVAAGRSTPQTANRLVELLRGEVAEKCIWPVGRGIEAGAVVDPDEAGTCSGASVL